MNTCPSCGASLTGAVGPDVPPTTRMIGVQIPRLYDGVLFWTCPRCGWAWPRTFPNQPQRAEMSRVYADQHNTTREPS